MRRLSLPNACRRLYSGHVGASYSLGQLTLIPNSLGLDLGSSKSYLAWFINSVSSARRLTFLMLTLGVSTFKCMSQFYLSLVLRFSSLGPEETEETVADSAGSTTALLTSPPPFFGHLTDEMLAFEKCLEGLCYHPQALRPADLLTHRLDILQHWITLESDLAHRKLKDLLAKPSAWRVDNK